MISECKKIGELTTENEMKHKHADVLIAIAEGKAVQWMNPEEGVWFDARFEPYTPLTNDEFEWRIKPEPKHDVVRYVACDVRHVRYEVTQSKYDVDNLKLTFDGETGKLKSAEVIS